MGPAVEAPAQKAMDAEQQQNQLQHQQCHVENEVLLEPFLHQVGGHCCLLRLGEKTICKPLLPSEHWFYKNVPAALKTFTPEYRGVVTASFEEDAEGNHCFKAYPLQSDSEEDLENKKPSTDSEPKSEMLCENYSKDGQSHRFCTDKDRSVYKQQQEHKVLYFRLEHSHNNAVPQLKHKPWIVEGQKYHLKKLKDKVMHCNRCKFILLENLTWQHTLPCVLDLKMGTQHYGDEEPEERKAMKIQQCQHSTSNLIGMYISGMQVYQCDTGQLMFISKFLGRRLSLQDFKDSLFQFFNSGRHLRRELFSPVLRRLRELKAAVETCESYRFYSSSLLIIYNAVPLQKHSENGSLKEEEDEDEDEDEDVEVERPPLVNVKMIDFAHATCSNYQGNSLVYEGTDSSYVSGLQNLITIISELENHSTD